MKYFAFGIVIICDRLLKIKYATNGLELSQEYIAKGFVIFISILGFLLLKYKLSLSKYDTWSMLILIGGISNLIDIFIYHYIVDYIPIFNYLTNLSDILITVGIFMLIIQIYNAKQANLKS